MSVVFVDRESAYPNRYRVIPESGEAYHVVLERADEAVTPGTPLNAETFNAVFGELGAWAGYGLGGGCKTISSWNNATENGWYLSNGDAPTNTYWYGNVSRHPNGLGCVQTAYQYQTADNIVRMCVRGRNGDGIWGNWEWVNPLMNVGTEYRTTERWNGKVVYTQLTLVEITATSQFGNILTSTPSLYTVTRHHGTMVSDTKTEALPTLDTKMVVYGYTSSIGARKQHDLRYQISASESDIGKIIHLQVWYTKD